MEAALRGCGRRRATCQFTNGERRPPADRDWRERPWTAGERRRRPRTAREGQRRQCKDILFRTQFENNFIHKLRSIPDQELFLTAATTPKYPTRDASVRHASRPKTLST